MKNQHALMMLMSDYLGHENVMNRFCANYTKGANPEQLERLEQQQVDVLQDALNYAMRIQDTVRNSGVQWVDE